MQFSLTSSTKMRGVIRLTRWKEYVLFVVPVTVFGALLALHGTGGIPDWRLIAAVLANILVVAYAFMINDIEDAPDDAREADRAARNPIASGELTPREGWIATLLVGLVTLAMYAAIGTLPFVIGAVTLVLSHLYSWKPIRLKKWPVTDVVSHSLMLSGLLFLTGYFAYGTQPGPVWLMALGVTLVSSYGQLYNQIRDYDMDVAAGLRNTAIMVGKRNTQLLMYGAVLVALSLMALALTQGVMPLWVLIALAIAIPVFFLLVRSDGDMRGTAAVDFSGNIQLKVMLVFNVAVLVWLVAAILRLA
jgi:4-hydroxybenzoate polyprenyltransferase